MKLLIKTLLIYFAALPMALAQSADTPDSPMGLERARLANERIQAEAEMRAREEQRRLEEEQQAKLRAQQAAARSAVAAAQNKQPAAAPGEAPGRDMSRTLQQLRTLGELKDDGYVSDEEFRKIKQRILDDQL